MTRSLIRLAADNYDFEWSTVFYASIYNRKYYAIQSGPRLSSRPYL